MMSEVLSADKPLATPKTADDIKDSFKDLDKVEEKEPAKKAKEKEETVEVEEEPAEEGDELEFVDPDAEESLDLSEEEEDPDKIEIDVPPRKKELLAKYPNLFKDFKYLEKVLYRDREYNQLFGSFDDAKEVAEKAEIFSDFENQLLSGNTEEVLKNVKETDPKAFDKIVDGYLKTLHKVDKEAYFEVVGNVSRQLIVEMVTEAKKSGNEDLQQAALLVNQFLFGTSEFSAPKARVAQKDNAEVSEAEQERLAFVQERFESSRNDLQTQTDNTLRATINEYIDPKSAMSSYIKKNAIADTMNHLGVLIRQDPAFQKNLDRLWRAAFDSKFSRDSLGKIKSYYLGRAKALLPNAMKKARAEALKDLAPRKASDEIEEQEETPRKRGPIPAGRTPQPKKNEMRKGESVAEFLARD